MDGVAIDHTLVDSNGLSGIYLIDRVVASVTDGIVRSNGGHGIMIERDGAGVTVRGNRIARNEIYGMYVLDSDGYVLQENRIYRNGRDGVRIETTQSGRSSGLLGRNRVWNNGASSKGQYDGVLLTSRASAVCDCLVIRNTFGNDGRGPRTQRNGITIAERVRGVRLQYNAFRNNLRFGVRR
jgi:parallel beta-helix repeat protein